MMPVSEYSWRTQAQAGDPTAISVLDETPVWSAPFGEALLEAVQMRQGLRVLDVGCGMGYPLLELASRLGPSARCAGLDPWKPVLDRARIKARVRHQDVDFLEGVAEAMPFERDSFDLVLSNNGLNNVTDTQKSLAECFRVAAPGAQFIMTANLPKTFGAFYAHFEEALEAAGHGAQIEFLRAHRAAKRLPSNAWRKLVMEAGFTSIALTHRSFSWRVLDGEALFAHPVFRLSFLPSWVAAVGEGIFSSVLPDLIQRLDIQALDRGGLEMEIPFMMLEARKG